MKTSHILVHQLRIRMCSTRGIFCSVRAWKLLVMPHQVWEKKLQRVNLLTIPSWIHSMWKTIFMNSLLPNRKNPLCLLPPALEELNKIVDSSTKMWFLKYSPVSVIQWRYSIRLAWFTLEIICTRRVRFHLYFSFFITERSWPLESLKSGNDLWTKTFVLR